VADLVLVRPHSLFVKFAFFSLLLISLTPALYARDLSGTFVRECTSERYSICFELRIMQTGSRAHVEFTAAFGDGHSAAPDGDGDGTVSATGVLNFHWRDSFFNEGTATLRPKGKSSYMLSMHPTKIVEQRPLQLYGDAVSLTKKSTPAKHQ
jgi:hypothetical protein